MKKLFSAFCIAFMGVLSVTALSAQCENWMNSPQRSEAEDAHVLYRGFIKEKNYEAAFPYWKKTYEIAPAADGQRSFHFMDGVNIYLHKYNNTNDPAEKEAFKQRIMKLYDQWVQCYPSETGYARGRQAYNMFYNLHSDYDKIAEVLKEAIEKGGKKSEYIVFDPYAHVTVYQFKNDVIGKEEARKRYEALLEIADHNIANNKTYGQYYQQGKDAMLATFSEIETKIFDCDYFKAKYIPQYKADPNNEEVYSHVYKKLVKGGCDKSDPIVYEIFYKDSIAKMEAYKKENPGFLANELYKQGNYTEAIAKYKEAIEDEDEPEKLANYYFAIASIEFRKLDRYSSARSHALKAAKLKPNWGQPYLLIGDMYATTSSTCGSNAFEKGLAVLAALDKYAYARAIDKDPDIQADANNKIARYSAYKPEQGEAFMMGIKAGESKSVPCWIGETVKVRFK